jgi:hypothetical protein
MHTSRIMTPVLTTEPRDGVQASIIILLNEVREHIQSIRTATAKAAPVENRMAEDLHGTFMQLSISVRNFLKWSR